MLRERITKLDDNAKAEKALEMLKELCNLNPEIEGCLWVSAFLRTCILSFANSGFSLQQTKTELMKACNNYEEDFEFIKMRRTKHE